MMKSSPFLLALNLLTATSVYADTTIRVSWTETFDRISPDPTPGISQTKNLSLTLQDNKMAAESYSLTAGRNFAKSWTTSASLGRGWKVASANSLVRIDSFPNLTTVMRIVVTGNTCTFSISHTMKPGAEYFLWPMSSQPGRAGRYTRLRASSTTCSIQ